MPTATITAATRLSALFLLPAASHSLCIDTRSLFDALRAAALVELVCLVDACLEDARPFVEACLVIECCFADTRLAEAYLVLVDCLDEG